MTAADDDLHLSVSTAIASVVSLSEGDTVQVGDMAQAAIDAVRRFDAAKVVPLRSRTLSIGWDDARKAALHMPDGGR